MTDACVICGATGRTEGHHVLPLDLHPATVRLCKPHHDAQTARQRVAGLLDPTILRTHPHALLFRYAVAVCIPDLLGAFIRHRGDEELAADFERDAQNCVRLIGHAAQVTPGQLGSRPSRRPRTGPAASAGLNRSADGPPAPRPLFAAIASVLADMNPDPAFAPMLAVIARGTLPAGAPSPQPAAVELGGSLAATLDAIDAQALRQPDAELLALAADHQRNRADAAFQRLFRAVCKPTPTTKEPSP